MSGTWALEDHRAGAAFGACSRGEGPAVRRRRYVAVMGFRIRRSFKIAPGVRMSVTPRGVGVSVGVRGAHLSANSRGQVRRSVGIPGTGLSYVSTSSTSSTSTTRRTVAPAQAPAQGLPKPGLFAPRWEKDLHRALLANDFTALEGIARADLRARRTCIFVDAVMNAYAGGDLDRAQSLTEVLWRENYEPSTDPFLHKYFPNAAIQLTVVQGITVTVPCDRDMLGLLLAEFREMMEDLPGAVEIVEQLTPTTMIAVLLAELYAQQRRWADVVELTDGVTNEDDFSTYLLIQRGVAFREQRYFDAAREAFKAAYAARSREPVLRRLALVERGQTYLVEGKKALARKDFEKVLSEDAHYPGLQEHLASLA